MDDPLSRHSQSKLKKVPGASIQIKNQKIPQKSNQKA
jgi:hypothetical protein